MMHPLIFECQVTDVSRIGLEGMIRTKARFCDEIGQWKSGLDQNLSSGTSSFDSFSKHSFICISPKSLPHPVVIPLHSAKGISSGHSFEGKKNR